MRLFGGEPPAARFHGPLPCESSWPYRRAWVPTTTSVILESGKQTPSPDLDSELAINTVATFLAQYVSAEYFGEMTIGLDIVQVEMGAKYA